MKSCNNYYKFLFAVLVCCVHNLKSLLQNFNIIKPNLKRVFLHDVMVTRLVFQNNEMAAMLGVPNQSCASFELFFHENAFFCSNKIA